MPAPEQLQKMKEILGAISSEINTDLEQSAVNTCAITGYSTMEVVPDEVSNYVLPEAACFLNSGLAANFVDMPESVLERQSALYEKEQRECAGEFIKKWNLENPDNAINEDAENLFEVIAEKHLSEKQWEFEQQWFSYGNETDVMLAFRFSENPEGDFDLKLVVNENCDVFPSLDDKLYNSWTFTPEALESCDPEEFAKTVCMDMFRQQPGGKVEENIHPRP